MSQDKGTLKTWNAERGFGFIKPDAGGKDIFAHISEFGRILREPRVGDKVSFQITPSKDGRIMAGNIYIEGLERIPATASIRSTHNKKPPTASIRKRVSIGLAFTIVTAGIGSLAYFLKTDTAPPSTLHFYDAPADRAPAFTCTGKQHCSQMTSCAEAKFYLENCPDVKIDGDGDKIPCERQWCR